MEYRSNRINASRRVNISLVLEHYGLHDWVKVGHELHGRCPIHHGSNPRLFVISLRDNSFRCFADFCKCEGDVLDFVAALEKCKPQEALRRIEQWFDSDDASKIEFGH